MPKELKEPKINKNNLIKMTLRNLNEHGIEITKEEERLEEEQAIKMYHLLNKNNNNNTR